jgi:hypothetical protein
MFLREVISQDRAAPRIRYAEIVEPYRNERGEQQHRVLLSLGPVDALDPETIRDLVRALSRYLGEEPVRDGLVLLDVREFGIGYALHGLWRRFGVSTGLRRILGRRTGASHVERSIFLLTVHRVATLANPHASYRWFSEQAWVPGARRILEEHIAQALAWLEEHRREALAVFEESFGVRTDPDFDGTPLEQISETIGRFLEDETGRTLAEIRYELGRVKAVERKAGARCVWETSVPSPHARDMLERLGLTAPPRSLPRPAKRGQRKST